MIKAFTRSAAVVAFACLAAPPALAVQYANFAEAGSTVSGYQDDFSGAALAPGWVEVDGGNDDPNPLFTVSGGQLVMNPAGGDPNKLLFDAGTAYSATNQNVLALLRVRTPGTLDPFRGGVTVSSDRTTGQGFNLHHRSFDPVANHYRLLDDLRAWGPRTSDTVGGDTWAAGEWKWLRLVTDGTTVSGKIWDAGTTPEPTAFDLTWTRGGRTGLAGLVTNSGGGQGVFDVDYVLIQAAGLPSITVVPEPSTIGLLSVTAMGLLGRRRRA